MALPLPTSGYILSLDVGDARIGTAIASVIARLPQPSQEIKAGHDAIKQFLQLAHTEDVRMIVIGIPRNLSGEETGQSEKIREFASTLKEQTDLPIVFADESMSSRRAAEMVRNTEFANISQDSLAACFILEEFFATIHTVK